MKVKVYCINAGTPAQYYGLITLEGMVVRACSNWKTKQGAIHWAQKHGYTVI